MKPFVFAVAMLLGSALAADAACTRVGTQVQCDWSELAVSLGTQTNTQEPAGPMQYFSGRDVMNPPLPARPGYAIGLQSFSNDPSSCRAIGNEVYCY